MLRFGGTEPALHDYVLRQLVDFSFHTAACPAAALLSLLVRLRRLSPLGEDAPSFPYLEELYIQQRKAWSPDPSIQDWWLDLESRLLREVSDSRAAAETPGLAYWNGSTAEAAELLDEWSPVRTLRVVDLGVGERRGLTEEGTLQRLFVLLGHAGRFFVEVRGNSVSTGLERLRSLGWRGVVVAPGSEASAQTWRQRVQPGDLDELFKRIQEKVYNFGDKNLDLLSIEADGGEYHLWQTMPTGVQPRVVLIGADVRAPPWFDAVAPRFGSPGIVLETGPVSAASVADRRRKPAGASTRAMLALFKQTGYTLIHIMGSHMIFVRNDVLRRAEFGKGLTFKHRDDIDSFWREAQWTESKV